MRAGAREMDGHDLRARVSSCCCTSQVLKRLRDQLDTELLTPVGTWQQIRKKAKHGI